MDSLEADVVVLGLGSGGEVVAQRLAEAGRRVVAVEAGLVGGACPYVACVPSKALLLAAAAGLSWPEAVRRRDEAAEHRDDAGHVQPLLEAGVHLVRGRGRVIAPGRLDVGGTAIAWREALVVATGSVAVAPDVPGLDAVDAWTTEQALAATELPGRLAVLGGGAAGCELAQAYAGFGARVTLLEPGPRLLGKEDAWVGTVLGEALATSIDVRCGVGVARAEPVDGGARLMLTDGAVLDVDRVLVAAGRRPRTDGLGLDALATGPVTGRADGPLRVDARCRVLDGDGRVVPGLFAVGDVTALAPFTHTATAQARHLVAHLLGEGRDLDPTGVPRGVYTDPPVLCAGLTQEQAREQGRDVVTARFGLADTARGYLAAALGDPVPGGVGLLVDAADGHLLGASAIGPGADSWGGQLALAVRQGLSVGELAEVVQAFPTWGEAISAAAEDAAAAVAGRAGRV